jgi:hypothetical protein
MVSVGALDRQEEAIAKSKHDQLRKLRVAAGEAVRRAIFALPVDVTEVSSMQTNNAGIDMISTGGIATDKPRVDREDYTQPRKGLVPQCALTIELPGRVACPKIPIDWERNRRVTLIRATGYRIAITDPGIEDSAGRRIFYQEEWVQRGVSVVAGMRWRVAVDTVTGQHTIVKTYPPRKRLGDIDDGTPPLDQDYLWRLEPAPDAIEPSRMDIEAAISEVTHQRAQLQSSVQDYKITIRHALAKNDTLLASQSLVAPDSGLSPQLRERLFAIRGHLSRATVVLSAETSVTNAIDNIAESIHTLEERAAWGNRLSDVGSKGQKLPNDQWRMLQALAEDEIDQALTTTKKAREVLPPDLSIAEAKFPSLESGVIVHIRRQPLRRSGNVLQCLQEVWRFGSPIRSGRQVERTVSVIALDARSGTQTVVGAGRKYYNASAEDPLEGVFNQYAGQDVPVSLYQEP